MLKLQRRHHSNDPTELVKSIATQEFCNVHQYDLHCCDVVHALRREHELLVHNKPSHRGYLLQSRKVRTASNPTPLSSPGWTDGRKSLVRPSLSTKEGWAPTTPQISPICFLCVILEEKTLCSCSRNEFRFILGQTKSVHPAFVVLCAVEALPVRPCNKNRGGQRASENLMCKSFCVFCRLNSEGVQALCTHLCQRM